MQPNYSTFSQQISIRQPHTTVRNMVYAQYKKHLQTDTTIRQSDIELEVNIIMVKFDKRNIRQKKFISCDHLKLHF